MMQQKSITAGMGAGVAERLTAYGTRFPKHALIGIILMVALFAFEIFNFDTTRYALNNLLGPVSFAGLRWAAILALAFCAIDFAGLVRLFTPERGENEPKEVWYLMGAWLLGATMNAVMTWWAVSLTLLNHEFGNEVMSRAQLLKVVPIFVAVLVWLTRILFIGALTVAGEHLLAFGQDDGPPDGAPRPGRSTPPKQAKRTSSNGKRSAPKRASRSRTRGKSVAAQRTRPAQSIPNVSDEVPNFLDGKRRPAPAAQPSSSEKTQKKKGTPRRPKREKPNGRVRQRPPMPGRGPDNGISASGRRNYR